MGAGKREGRRQRQGLGTEELTGRRPGRAELKHFGRALPAQLEAAQGRSGEACGNRLG